MNPETQVQLAIIETWRLLFKRNPEILIAIPNGVRLTPIQARMAVAMGLYRGASDLLLIRQEGKSLWIEVKRPEVRVHGRVVQRGGTTEDSQTCFQNKIEILGHEYVVVDSTDGFLAALAERGVKPIAVSVNRRF